MAEKWEKKENWGKFKDSGGQYAFDEEMLDRAFEEARRIYRERGFQRRMGYGKAPAVTTVDMAKAWMSDGHPFTCENTEEVCANALKVLEAARKCAHWILTLSGWKSTPN